MISSWDDYFDHMFEPIPGSTAVRWRTERELVAEMTAGFRAEYLRGMDSACCARTRRTVIVATRKYRARRKRH